MLSRLFYTLLSKVLSPKNSLVINMESYNKGIYYFQIITNESNYTSKVIK